MDKLKFYDIIDYLHRIINGTEFENNVYAVGGSVRDIVMDKDPKDIDLVISLNEGGIRFAEWMEKNGLTTGSVVTYPTYGTAMFKLNEYPDEEIECVQTRKEQYHDKNSRNPETSFGTIKEDAFRRDLTINALYYDISKREIIDPLGKGFEDIEKHILRITNPDCDIVLQDDPLRILRVIRFFSRYGWEIEKNTKESLQKNAYRLTIITEERVQDEFCKILKGKYNISALGLLKDLGILQYIHPYLFKMTITKHNRHKGGFSVWEHTLLLLENLKNDKIEVILAGLFHDIGKCVNYEINENGERYFSGGEHALLSAEVAAEIMKELKFSNKMIDDVCFYIKHHMDTKRWGNLLEHCKDKDVRKLQYECKERTAGLLDLIDADNKAFPEEFQMPNQVALIRARGSLLVNQGTGMFNYKLPINGEDIMKWKQIGPSPKIKKYLDAALKMAFSDPSLTKEQLLRRLKF